MAAVDFVANGLGATAYWGGGGGGTGTCAGRGGTLFSGEGVTSSNTARHQSAAELADILN